MADEEQQQEGGAPRVSDLIRRTEEAEAARDEAVERARVAEAALAELLIEKKGPAFQEEYAAALLEWLGDSPYEGPQPPLWILSRLDRLAGLA